MANQKKVLIIEDDAPLREMYKTRLEAAKFKVLEAKDGEEGINLALEEHPDLILLDILMPKKGGLGVLEILKTNPSTKPIPVIILTALLNEEYRSAASRFGVTDYFVKSQSMPGDILKKVQEVLGVQS